MSGAATAAWLLAVPLLLATACAPTRPIEVTLATLAAEQEAYDGRTVITQGAVVQARDAPGDEPYHVLQDGSQNRVRLVPSGWARDHESEVVSVTGVFRFVPDSGRELVIQRIHALR